MKTEKVFLYDNLCEPDIQQELFGVRFGSDEYMDYVNDWDLVGIKINGTLRKVAIEGGNRTAFSNPKPTSLVQTPGEVLGEGLTPDPNLEFNDSVR